jgi:hypothetical protein
VSPLHPTLTYYIPGPLLPIVGGLGTHLTQQSWIPQSSNSPPPARCVSHPHSWGIVDQRTYLVLLLQEHPRPGSAWLCCSSEGIKQSQQFGIPRDKQGPPGLSDPDHFRPDKNHTYLRHPSRCVSSPRRPHSKLLSLDVVGS